MSATESFSRKDTVVVEAKGQKQNALEVSGLSIQYDTPGGAIPAVNHISFVVKSGETLGLVGESGCGKSTTAMGILRLISSPGRITAGHIMLDGKDLLALNDHQMRDVRWRQLALIPQGAMNSLNPVMQIGAQLLDAIKAHEPTMPRYFQKRRIEELLTMVGLPLHVTHLFPHELSGGMKQRVCIAMAVSLNPTVIIADEPTSALDVVTQRLVAETLRKVKAMTGVSMLLIGHDMGLQAQLADRIAVMYAGQIVEIGRVRDIFRNPLHPYTRLLIEATPSIKRHKKLIVTESAIYNIKNPPPGCVFQLRCPYVMDECRTVMPTLSEVAPEHFVACYLHKKSQADYAAKLSSHLSVEAEGHHALAD